MIYFQDIRVIRSLQNVKLSTISYHDSTADFPSEHWIERFSPSGPPECSKSPFDAITRAQYSAPALKSLSKDNGGDPCRDRYVLCSLKAFLAKLDPDSKDKKYMK